MLRGDACLRMSLQRLALVLFKQVHHAFVLKPCVCLSLSRSPLSLATDHDNHKEESVSCELKRLSSAPYPYATPSLDAQACAEDFQPGPRSAAAAAGREHGPVQPAQPPDPARLQRGSRQVQSALQRLNFPLSPLSAASPDTKVDQELGHELTTPRRLFVTDIVYQQGGQAAAASPHARVHRQDKPQSWSRNVRKRTCCSHALCTPGRTSCSCAWS